MGILCLMQKVTVVGSGFYGLTMAFLISERFKVEVEVLERRNHIGGNAHSYLDQKSGIEIHKYGSHLFHTSNLKVWKFINQFSNFNSYKHVVWADHDNRIFSLPINLATINAYLQTNLNPDAAREWLRSQTEVTDLEVRSTNLEDKAIKLVGRTLYEAFIRGYTKKQWQTDPRLLPEDIVTRLPVRLNYNNSYFDDEFQGLPIKGYFGIFREMVASQNIKISIDTDFFEVRDRHQNRDLLIYTGPIDRYFNFMYGRLGWRTLDFEFEHLPIVDFQGCSVINYSDEHIPYTRIHEFKHLHPERRKIYEASRTVIAKEFSRLAGNDDEPYYPINTPSDRSALKLYRSSMAQEKNVIFGGRLGTYKYLDMHMAIASAISDFENSVVGRLT